MIRQRLCCKSGAESCLQGTGSNKEESGSPCHSCLSAGAGKHRWLSTSALPGDAAHSCAGSLPRGRHPSQGSLGDGGGSGCAYAARVLGMTHFTPQAVESSTVVALDATSQGKGHGGEYSVRHYSFGSPFSMLCWGQETLGGSVPSWTGSSSLAV